MKKDDYDFIAWCRCATHLIRYGPDRRAVADELQAHLQDHRDDLMSRGMAQEDAARNALESMGSAEEIAPQLAAVHKPFWGYFLRVNLILLIALFCLCLIPLWNYAANLQLYEKPNVREFDVYSSTSYGGSTGRTLHHLSQPHVSFSSDGSTFTVTDAVVFTEISPGDGVEHTQLHILIRQSSLLPYREHGQFFRYGSISDTFLARDSLGNTYCQSGSGLPCLNTVGKQSGIFTFTHECWINDFPADAQWVDICYERDGRSCTLRVHLTGGDRE